MSILVTGGAGYVGSLTVAALQQRGDPVVILDDLSTGHRDAVAPSLPFYQGDIADQALVTEIVRKHDVTQVIHFAAYSLVGASVADPASYFTNNTAGALSLFDALRRCNVKNIVFSSTAATYGEPRTTPIDEDHPKAPTNPYGLSKYFVEQILDTFDQAYGMTHVALRYFNACGASETRGEDHSPETHLIPLILQVASGQRPAVSIFGNDYPTPDGTCIRDYIHVEDLAAAHLAALDYLHRGGISQKINLGNGKGFSVREVIDTARSVTGHPIPEIIVPRRAGDPSILIASAARAQAILDWAPRYALRPIIKSAWAWHQSRPYGYDDRGARRTIT